MKNSLAVIAGLALASVATSYAAVQPTVAVNNYGSAAGTIMFKADASAAEVLLPADAWIQVFGGAAGGALTALGAPFQPSEPGYFDNNPMVVPGATAGAAADFEVKAWVGATTYEAATLTGKISFSQTTGSWEDGVGSGNPPGPMSGPDLAMPTFTVGAAIPEPSTIALGMLGAAALLLRRRK